MCESKASKNFRFDLLKFSGVTRLDLADWKGTRDGALARVGGSIQAGGTRAGASTVATGSGPRPGVRRKTAGAQCTGGLDLTQHPMGRGKRGKGKGTQISKFPR